MFNRKQLFFIILNNLLKAGAVVLVAALAIIFLSKEISKISASIKEQKILSLVLDKRSENLSRLRNDFEAIAGADEKIKAAFPPEDNILEFVAALEDLASRNSVEQTLNFESPAGSSINYNIGLNGNIISLIDYLGNFEKLPYFTSISGVNLTAPNGDWNGNSAISLRAKVYTK